MTESEVFKAVVKLSAERRAAYLDQVCGANSESCAPGSRVASASALNNLGTFCGLNLPHCRARSMNCHSRKSPGAVIGPYKLLQQIGEGGMGVVYMAEQQEPIRRKVALKVLKPGTGHQASHRPLRGGSARPGS